MQQEPGGKKTPTRNPYRNSKPHREFRAVGLTYVTNVTTVSITWGLKPS